MTTWIVRSQVGDLNGARMIVRENQIRGHIAWIEDEYGRRVDDEGPQNKGVEQARHRGREIWMAILAWMIPLLVGVSGLYILGLWVDRDL